MSLQTVSGSAVVSGHAFQSEPANIALPVGQGTVYAPGSYGTGVYGGGYGTACTGNPSVTRMLGQTTGGGCTLVTAQTFVGIPPFTQAPGVLFASPQTCASLPYAP